MKSRKFTQHALALILAAVLTVGLLPIRASAASVTFTDVSPSAWYYNDVTYLANKGIVSGVGDNKFEPNREVANCEMLQMVINAYFRDNYDAYEAYNYDAMCAYFGSNIYWFSFKAHYAKYHIDLLDGINIDISSYASCYQPMSRYEMALILTNAAKAEGIEATEAQKAAVQSKITDYASIPAAYQDAAKNCYALGLLNGKNGAFAGSDNMTRAEACTVIVRLENLIVNGIPTQPVDPDPTPTPDPTPSQPVVPSSGIKDIKGSQFETAINALYAGGIITDDDLTNGNFRPDDDLLTGEQAMMWIRMFSNVPLVPESEWPSQLTYMGTDYLWTLKTPEGLAAYSLGRYITGYKGAANELNTAVAVRDMRNHINSLTYYTTNTASDTKWKPAYHGYGQPLTQEYGDCGAFVNNLDQARMGSTSWSVNLTRGEWAQVMYNLGVTQAGQLTALKNQGGTIG